MIWKRLWFKKVKYDFYFGMMGFGFCKYSFKKTSMTFLYDWNLRLGFVSIAKWQSKSFNELKKMSDLAWDEKWGRAGYKTDPKIDEGVK